MKTRVRSFIYKRHTNMLCTGFNICVTRMLRSSKTMLTKVGGDMDLPHK